MNWIILIILHIVKSDCFDQPGKIFGWLKGKTGGSWHKNTHKYLHNTYVYTLWNGSNFSCGPLSKINCLPLHYIVSYNQVPSPSHCVRVCMRACVCSLSCLPLLLENSFSLSEHEHTDLTAEQDEYVHLVKARRAPTSMQTCQQSHKRNTENAQLTRWGWCTCWLFYNPIHPSVQLFSEYSYLNSGCSE